MAIVNKVKPAITIFLLSLFFLELLTTPIGALSPTIATNKPEEATISADAIPAVEGSSEAEKAKAAAKLTETTEEVRGRLESILDKQKLGPLAVTNFIKYAIRQATGRGIPLNTIVLVFLVPVAATLIAFFRYVIGFAGFGIFTPVMISVAFIATGLTQGLVLFLTILFTAILFRFLTRRLRTHFLARMSLLLLFISLGVFGLFYFGPKLGFPQVADISIFPILIIILLVENFMEILIGKSRHEAFQMTWQTLLIAIVGFYLFRWSWLQEQVLLHPEAIFLLVILANLFLGRYTKLRLLEYPRFRSIAKSKKSL
ncbi:hypothetical protein KBI33_03170 [Candidatus Shapirobacteria bacterium]|nr:hypothetical protein [Candidatus Shapirobacteria bacterium]